MSDRFDMANALVQDSRTRVSELQKAYEDSLHERTVSTELKIGIKNIIENLRSALDYCAKEIHSRFGSGANTDRVYFPIARPGANSNDFRSLVGRSIPGLQQTRPDIVNTLASFQEFSDRKNIWLPHLATLANENKHEQLTPQTRTETQRISVDLAAGHVSWNPEGVRFGSGVLIGGVPVNPKTQLPQPHPSQTVKREIWVSFIFKSIDQPVLPFLNTCVDGVEIVVKELRSKT